MGEPESQVGRRIAGKYRLEALIGQGGFSEVYRGTHLAMDRAVAVKILKPDSVGGTDGTWTQRFSREAHVISKLHHPNTVTVFDSGSEGGVLYLVMEYIEGMTLKAYAKNYGALSLQRAISLGIALASSLEEAHHHGVLHRDLKPANIMISQDFKGADVFKVLDFGIAKWITDAQSERNMELTQKNSFVGTPRYAAPEQIFGQQLSPATDVYGVGMILWYALTGHHAIAPSAWQECMQVHLRPDPLQMPSDARIPRSLQAIVNRAIARKPRERYTSTPALLEALESWLRDNATLISQDETRIVQTPHGGLPSIVSEQHEAHTVRGVLPMGSTRLNHGALGHTVDASNAPRPKLPEAPEPDMSALETPVFDTPVFDAPEDEDSLVFVHHNNIIDPNLFGSDFDPDPSLDLSRFDRFGQSGLPQPDPSTPRRRPQRSEQPTPFVGPDDPIELATISEVAIAVAPPVTSPPPAEELPVADASPSIGRVQQMRQERAASQQMFGRVLVGLAVAVLVVVVVAGVYRTLSTPALAPESPPDALDGLISEAAQEDEAPKARGTFSFAGIRRAIAADDWRVTRMEKSIDLPSLTQQTVGFRKGSALLHVTFMETRSQEMMRDFKEKSKFPARVIDFEDKVVRLLPSNGSGREQIGALEEHLQQYRDMVLERSAQTP